MGVRCEMAELFDKAIHQTKTMQKIVQVGENIDISPVELDAYTLKIFAEEGLDVDVHFDSPGHRIELTLRRGSEGAGPRIIDDYGGIFEKED